MLVEVYGTEQLFWLEHNLEDVRTLLQSTNLELVQEGKELMRALYCRIGNTAIQLAKTLSWQHLEELEQFAGRYVQVHPF